MNILVAIDLSDASQEILDNAKTLSLALSAKVWLLHVVEPEPEFVGYRAGPQSVRDQVAHKFHEERDELQKEVNDFRKSGIDITALFVQGSTVDVIYRESKKLEIDIIIVGSHGHGGVYHLVFGSVSEGVLHKSSCPVMVIPTHNRT
ncbi:MAG: universal stress protein [Candidatus Scalindua sp.]|jgi:nucleotide-binding universal stress UspA family protein|nr:universal stress protein [Candidatus Scalindua sp.]MBT5304882.1 universal stress protein [Candidatus Scalindua sp.]MBT6046331.1 universal stress protein [Candidatus Scalindua sp.]MBT6230767.1 universal stress protein [Candidatus Scalindua sp.]MBT6561217.1 universal stress protein [Candidatus Scalindua sp.]